MALKSSTGVIEPGQSFPLGATPDKDGSNFAVYSAHAEQVYLCLFDDSGQEIARHELPACSAGIWHGYLPKCRAGQRYGYRAHGPYKPADGHHFNHHKLLLDPYARQIDGELNWREEVFGYRQPAKSGKDWLRDERDSAPYVPKSIVSDNELRASILKNPIPWSETIVYETHIRGFTMLHPEIPTKDRGRYAGLTHHQALDYLKSLGVTSIELLPVHELVDEQFLVNSERRNYWGYNPINFFTSAARYRSSPDNADFVEMVNAIHDAGLEVILDVVYNHTAEGNERGPTLSYRGLDNLSYYRLDTTDHSRYVNDTGCGNTFNVNHPQVLQLIMDSLRYWKTEMAVDGFRFDLATVLGRNNDAFERRSSFVRRAPFFAALRQDPALAGAKLIAEPWDVGINGYQLGEFPSGWAEWNDRFRDTLRRFWHGEPGLLPEFARRVHGSADLFEANRDPFASINYVCSHDGFTLADVVSYDNKHNEANGEDNVDGHDANYSCNHGVEGATDLEEVLEIRNRQRLNMLATVLFSQGTPMLLAGDEFGNSQQGNNNAYAQDNEIGWLNWDELDKAPEFQAAVEQLIALRRELGLLRQGEYLHGQKSGLNGYPDISWLDADAELVSEDHWASQQHITLFLAASDSAESEKDSGQAIALMFNGEHRELSFGLPDCGPRISWKLRFSSDDNITQADGNRWKIAHRSLALFVASKAIV